jgi:hypothetical protein
VNAIHATVEAVKDKISTIKPTIYANAKVTAKGEVGGSAEIKGAGVSANVKGRELGSITVGAHVNAKTGEVTNESEANYDNKNGYNRMSSGGSVDAVAGASYEKETIVNSDGKVINTTKTATASAGYGGIGIEDVVSSENGVKSVSTGIGGGGSVGAFLNFSFEFHIGLKLS